MNLTITVDSDLLKRARIRALQEETSVNAAGMGERRRGAVADLLALSGAAMSQSGSARWTRDELYER